MESKTHTFQLDLSRPRLVALVGKCGSGKSVAMKSLLKSAFQSGIFKFGILYCPTKDLNAEDYKFLPDRYVHDSFTESHLASHLEKLKKWKQRNPKKQMPHSFICFDDVIGQNFNTHSPFLTKYWSTFRHYGTSVIISSQYGVANLSTCFRTILDYCFIWKNTFKRSRKALVDFAGQLLDDPNELLQMIDKLKKYECVVYNAHGTSKDNAYFIWKANLPGDFRIEYSF